MSEIHIITKPELKSKTRSLTELGITGLVWGLWLYLFLPIANVLLWVVGITTFEKEFIEQGGVFIFLELIQQMGWVILVAFLVMRLWGIYNYYHFGRHDKRTHMMPDSIEKLCHFYQLKPDELAAIENHKQIIWPVKKNNENAKTWLQQKSAHLSPEQKHEDDGNIFMQFHEVHEENKELSITSAAVISLLSIFTVALLLLYAADGLGLSETATPSSIVPTAALPSTTVEAKPQAKLSTAAVQPAGPAAPVTEPAAPQPAVDTGPDTVTAQPAKITTDKIAVPIQPATLYNEFPSIWTIGDSL